MQHFDIAKYLREHQQGSFGILNHYIDLKPLKEEREEIFDKSDPESGEDALEWILDNIEGPDKDRILDKIQIYDRDNVRDAEPEDIVDMINGVIEDHEINFDEDEDRFQLTIVSKDMEEDKDLGQQDAMPEPYEGPEDPIDGLGGELDRDMDVSMNEEGSMHDKMSQEYQAWLRKNNLPQMSADELLNDPSIKKTDAQIAYIKDFIDKWEAVNEEGAADMEEAEYQHRDIDSYPESERIMDLGGQQIEQGIISLLDDGFDARDIVDLVKELLTAHISAKAQGKSF